MVYIDDIVVYSRDEASHKDHVTRVLQLLSDFGLVLKEKKCTFHRSELRLLGYVVSGAGIRADTDKTAAIAAMPPPVDVKGCNMLDKNETADAEINLPVLPATDQVVCITKWDQSLCSTCIDAFDLDRLQRLGTNLNACNTGNVSQNEIDIYAQDLCDIYILPAKLCGMEKTYRENTATQVKKNTR